MKKYDAIGIVEVQYFAVALDLLDHMCKAANVELLVAEKSIGGRLVVIFVGGSVSDVNIAIESVTEYGADMPLKMALVIVNPHKEIMRYIV